MHACMLIGGNVCLIEFSEILKSRIEHYAFSRQEGQTLYFIPAPDASLSKPGLSIGTMESLEIPFLDSSSATRDSHKCDMRVNWLILI